MTHNARVISRSPTPGVDTLPELWLWLECKEISDKSRICIIREFDALQPLTISLMSNPQEYMVSISLTKVCLASGRVFRLCCPGPSLWTTAVALQNPQCRWA